MEIKLENDFIVKWEKKKLFNLHLGNGTRGSTNSSQLIDISVVTIPKY